MGKRLILGTKPEVDPLAESSESSFSVTSSTEIRWDSRKIGRSVGLPLLVSLVIIAIGLYSPLTILSIGAFILLIVVFTPSIRSLQEKIAITGSHWQKAQEADTSCSLDEDKKTLNCKTPVGMMCIGSFSLGDAGSILLGDISSFIRAVDGEDGFNLAVTMRPERIQHAMDEERVSRTIENFLNYLPKGELDAYISRRGGLWGSQVTVTGHVKDSTRIQTFESAVRASIPMEKWKCIQSKALSSQIGQLQIENHNDWLYAVGSELSEWLVQLRSELASEVGGNIPGQFLAPIRNRPGDYRLGVTINPDTLQTGPIAGFAHGDLENGMFLCGGTSESRMRVIALLVKELLEAKKRVIIFTNNQSSVGFTRLSEGAVHLELGRDLVLNPIDSEGIPRSDYVPLLISSLEPVSGADLRGAADLELAISRAVTLGNATLADVQLDTGPDENMTGPSATARVPEQSPSKKSLCGMEAIRSLHQGPAAKAFYGTQTAPIQRLTESNLTVVRVRLGSTSLDHFAWNLISVKLAGLRSDSELVVILDGAENMRVRNRRFMKHDSFSERLLENLKQRGPVVLALEHPVDMAPGAIGTLRSCISLRLREAVDIKIASDLLGLNVITTPMHTKARISPRESSYLNIMDDDTALLVHDGTEICQPIRLDPAPDLDPESIIDDETRRIDTFLSEEGSLSEHQGTLLDKVSAGRTNLTIRVLKLLERYEPLTLEAVRRFIISSGSENDPDVEAILARLEHASMILRGHEVHSGVSYTNYRITMKGSMALRQTEGMEGAVA